MVVWLTSSAKLKGGRPVTDYEAIRDTIFNYFDGYRTKDRNRLEKAFAVEVANMMGYWKNPNGEQELFSVPMKELIDKWVSADYSPYDFSEGKILNAHVFSDSAANVVFDCSGRFMDTFQLVKMDGDWRIVNKFFVDQ